MKKSTKKYVIAAVAATLVALAAAGSYWGYKASGYVLLSPEDQGGLMAYIQAYAQQAYMAGLAACNKGT